MKRLTKTNLGAPLSRVTVDELLGDSLVRLLAAKVKDGLEAVSIDDIDGFENEEEALVTHAECATLLDLKGEALKEAVAAVGGGEVEGRTGTEQFWRALKEGQVFMVGYFDVSSNADDAVAGQGPPCMVSAIGKGPWRILRIDRADAVKKSQKRLYADALTAWKGGRNG